MNGCGRHSSDVKRSTLNNTVALDPRITKRRRTAPESCVKYRNSGGSPRYAAHFRYRFMEMEEDSQLFRLSTTRDLPMRGRFGLFFCGTAVDTNSMRANRRLTS